MHLTDTALEGPLLEALLAETAHPETGALVIFGGTVRLDGKVAAIDYTGYGPMAEKALRGLEAETKLAFRDIESVRIVHRLGLLKVGELSVLVVVRSGHRPQAFEAARWIMDELKARVPVYKQEHYLDGSKEYLPGTPLTGP